MAIGVWSESHSVGIEQVDREHRELLELVNRLETVVVLEMGKEEGEIIFQSIVNGALRHFANEEKLLKHYLPARSDSHMKEHEDLRLAAARLQERVHTGNMKLNLDVVIFLNDWLERHIMETDKRDLMPVGLAMNEENGTRTDVRG
jgi:hemerythrin-like metal-binding protein